MQRNHSADRVQTAAGTCAVLSCTVVTTMPQLIREWLCWQALDEGRRHLHVYQQDWLALFSYIGGEVARGRKRFQSGYLRRYLGSCPKPGNWRKLAIAIFLHARTATAPNTWRQGVPPDVGGGLTRVLYWTLRAFVLPSVLFIYRYSDRYPSTLVADIHPGEAVQLSSAFRRTRLRVAYSTQ